jgi:hypothetical protein
MHRDQSCIKFLTTQTRHLEGFYCNDCGSGQLKQYHLRKLFSADKLYLFSEGLRTWQSRAWHSRIASEGSSARLARNTISIGYSVGLPHSTTLNLALPSYFVIDDSKLYLEPSI